MGLLWLHLLFFLNGFDVTPVFWLLGVLGGFWNGSACMPTTFGFENGFSVTVSLGFGNGVHARARPRACVCVCVTVVLVVGSNGRNNI